MTRVPEFFSAEDLLDRTDPPRMIAAMEEALEAIGSDSLILPPRQHLDHLDSTMLVMPAAGYGLYVTKLVTVKPLNADGLPAVQGLVVLFSAETGEPLAVMDATVLTGQRTGAVAAIGIKYLAPPDLDHLGIIGTGVQGAWAAVHTAAVRPVNTLFCLPRSRSSFERFCATVTRFAGHLRITACTNVEELLGRAKCIVTATPSRIPVLPDDPACLEGKTFVAIGSYRSDMQELPCAAYRIARAILVDGPQAAEESGDLINPLTAGLIEPSAVIQLSELVAGRKILEAGATRIFKSVGNAAFDIFAAKAVQSIRANGAYPN